VMPGKALDLGRQNGGTDRPLRPRRRRAGRASNRLEHPTRSEAGLETPGHGQDRGEIHLKRLAGKTFRSIGTSAGK
jgi:hypothetical protein